MWAAVLAAGLAAGVWAVLADGAPQRPTESTAKRPGAVVPRPDPPTSLCAGSQRAITFYRQGYRASREAMGLPGPVPRQWYGCEAARRRAVEWRDRATLERAVFAEWNSTIGRVVRRLDAGLAGTPMAGLGAILEREGRRYGVSPFLMAAAAGTESSFGAAPCRPNFRNVWGLAACDGRWHVPYFETWDEAIGFYARFLAERWPGHSSPYSFVGYAACDACWGRKTSMHMGRFGSGTSSRYEAATTKGEDR